MNDKSSLHILPPSSLEIQLCKMSPFNPNHTCLHTNKMIFSAASCTQKKKKERKASVQWLNAYSINCSLSRKIHKGTINNSLSNSQLWLNDRRVHRQTFTRIIPCKRTLALGISEQSENVGGSIRASWPLNGCK